MKILNRTLLPLLVGLMMVPSMGRAIDLSSCQTAADSLAMLIPLESNMRYGYANFCTDNEKKLYLETLRSYINFEYNWKDLGAIENRAFVYPADAGATNPGITAYMNLVNRMTRDVPELYILNSYIPRSTTGGYYIRLRLAYAPWRLASELAQIVNMVEEMVAPTVGMNDYDKALYLHDKLCEKANYGDMTGADSGNIKGIYLNGRGVCQGWAYAYLLACQKAGLNCLYVDGAINQTPDDETASWAAHAFNYVQVDGEWYLVDVSSDHALGGIGHNYFLKGQDFFDWDYTLGYGGPDGGNANLVAYPDMPSLRAKGYGVSLDPDPDPEPDPDPDPDPDPEPEPDEDEAVTVHLSAADILALPVGTQKTVAIRGMSATNDQWLSGSYNSANITLFTLTRNADGVTLCLKGNAQGYLQTDGYTTGSAATAATFVPSCPNGSSLDTYTTESGWPWGDGNSSDARKNEVYDKAVRLALYGGSTWINIQGRGSRSVYNSGKGGWTIFGVYDMDQQPIVTYRFLYDGVTLGEHKVVATSGTNYQTLSAKMAPMDYEMSDLSLSGRVCQLEEIVDVPVNRVAEALGIEHLARCVDRVLSGNQVIRVSDIHNRVDRLTGK